MNCPTCSKTSRVMETRGTQAGIMRRRRVCLSCEQRFTTIEVVISEGTRTTREWSHVRVLVIPDRTAEDLQRALADMVVALGERGRVDSAGRLPVDPAITPAITPPLPSTPDNE